MARVVVVESVDSSKELVDFSADLFKEIIKKTYKNALNYSNEDIYMNVAIDVYGCRNIYMNVGMVGDNCLLILSVTCIN